MKGSTRLLKKLGSVVAVLMMVIALVVVADCFSIVSYAATEAKVLKDTVNIRKEPNQNSAKVGNSTKDKKLEVISQTTGKDGKVWYKVKVDAATTGYVRSDLVEITDGSTPPKEDANAANADTSQKTTTTTDSSQVELLVEMTATATQLVNFRSSPDNKQKAGDNILAELSKDTEVKVIGRTTGADGKEWYQIKAEVKGEEKVGYVRSDYLKLSGEPQPLSEVTVEPDEPDDAEPADTDTAPEATTNDDTAPYKVVFDGTKWMLYDYEAPNNEGGKGASFDIEDKKTDYVNTKLDNEKLQKKVGSLKIWLMIFVVISVGVGLFAAYLVYRIKDYKEEAFIASIESNTMNGRSRAVDRPRNRDALPSVGRDKPAINNGMESRRESVSDERRSAGASGQGARSAGASGQGARPAGASGQGARPAGANGQGARPTGATGQGARPAGANGQGARPAGASGQGARPMTPDRRPENSVRSEASMQTRRDSAPVDGRRPVAPQTQNAGGRPQDSRASQDNAKKAKNFLEENDDFEFEFLNWDGDDE